MEVRPGVVGRDDGVVETNELLLDNGVELFTTECSVGDKLESEGS